MLGRLKIIAAYAVCVLIWSTTWLGIKISLASVPPIAGAGFRFIAAGLALYGLAIFFRIDLKRQTPSFGVIATLALTMFGANYALTYTAETRLASGMVAVLFGTLPFFVFLFAHYMLNERLNWNTIIGAAIALGGVAAISLSGNEHLDFVYVAAAVGAAALSGYANVYLKKFAHTEPLATLPPAMLLAGVVMAIVGVRFEGIQAKAFSPSSLMAIIYLALCGSALAFYINHWLLKRIDSSTMGLSALMIPVVAVIVGATLGHESFSTREVLGGLLVVIGVGLSFVRGSSTKEARA